MGRCRQYVGVVNIALSIDITKRRFFSFSADLLRQATEGISHLYFAFLFSPLTPFVLTSVT